MISKETTINKTNIYTGSIIKLDIHDVVLENGTKAKREIITHPGGVGIIAVTEKDEIYFVQQYRKPYEAEVLEIPAGKLDRGEDPRNCAIRELKEETGLTARSFTYLGEMYPSPGYTDEIIRIFKAEGISLGESDTDEDEFLDVIKLPMEKACEMVKQGLIKDAKTAIALLMLMNERLTSKLNVIK
ncbi:MAG: NUDIX hydrolase [Caulobacteraceae bacterium]